MLYDDKKFIGNVIKNARIKAKMTQAELAEKINMTEKNFNGIENGRQFPAVNNFLRIAEILNIPLFEFGVNLSLNAPDTDAKKQLIDKILNADIHACIRYLKAVKFTDEIMK